jgi:quinol monooxygenase YgiN
MTKSIQVNLTVDPSRVDEFINIIEEDKQTALKSPFIINFDVIQNDNKFIIEQSYSSDEYITKHHKEAHYRWTNFAKSGGVLNIDHKFI